MSEDAHLLDDEVRDALAWLTRVHDSDPSAQRLAILRDALLAAAIRANAADAQRQEAVSFAEHWRIAASRGAPGNATKLRPPTS